MVIVNWIVIASEAKQSSPPLLLDCFASLAMTDVAQPKVIRR